MLMHKTLIGLFANPICNIRSNGWIVTNMKFDTEVSFTVWVRGKGTKWYRADKCWFEEAPICSEAAC